MFKYRSRLQNNCSESVIYFRFQDMALFIEIAWCSFLNMIKYTFYDEKHLFSNTLVYQLP